jgi:hypothetical protein
MFGAQMGGGGGGVHAVKVVWLAGLGPMFFSFFPCCI